MNTQLAIKPERVSALNIMGARLSVDPIKLMSTLKATVFKNATDDELLALVVVANEYRLNPLTKEIYAFPAKGGGIVPVVSVDGWISMVNDHPAMDGMEFEEHYGDEGKLEAITCKLWRKDRNRPISVTEHLSECKRATDPWKMEHRMLRHKALMQCARYAFGFSGVTDEDEAAETPGMRDVTPSKGKASGEVIDPFKQADDTPKPLSEAVRDRKAAQTAAEFTQAPDLSNAPNIDWETETPDLL
jgi:phage recombination protein Bet